MFSFGFLNGVPDTEGPVAGGSDTSLTSFDINTKQKEPFALLAGGATIAQQGTIRGSVLYAFTYADTQVTYVGASRPTGSTNPFPVNFTSVATKLTAMSLAIKNYTAIPAVKQSSTLTMTGCDPEMNVFSVSPSQLVNTYSYVFNVPFGSTAFVNVTGTTPTIANAGFSGNLSGAQILWNFPDATSLAMSSITLPGSILAPKAWAQLQNGSITGTVVVNNAWPSNMELYAAPFRIPSSVGTRALRVDPSWSMTGNVSDDRTATDLTNEAGFLDVPANTYIGEGTSRASAEHRIWYAFQPAAVQPKRKPLAVFFNGGPGSATSAYLFSFNTSTWTLDPCKVGGPSCTVGASKTAFNASTWTQFANLLYIDSPAAGFSYPIGGADPAANPSLGLDVDRDAGIFNYVLLRFLLRHPQILANPVMLVGESYGGMRATTMLEHLFDYPKLTSPLSTYQDNQVAAQESDFFLTALGTSTPTRQQLSSKFNALVMIEPALVGGWQVRGPTQGTPDQFNRAANCLPDNTVSDGAGGTMVVPCWSSNMPMAGLPGWDATCDAYDCDKPPRYSDSLVITAAGNLNTINVLTQMTGANIRNIEWMYGRARQSAYGRVSGSAVETPELASPTAFGPLNDFDRYFMIDNDEAFAPYPGAQEAWYTDVRGSRNAAFLINRLIDGVSMFITATKHDTIVYSPDIRYAIENVRLADPVKFSVVTGTSYDKTADNPFIYPPGTVKARHGRMGIDISSPHTTFYVTMPGFYESGHTVSLRAPGELLADVMDWYAKSHP